MDKVDQNSDRETGEETATSEIPSTSSAPSGHGEKEEIAESPEDKSKDKPEGDGSQVPEKSEREKKLEGKLKQEQERIRSLTRWAASDPDR